MTFRLSGWLLLSVGLETPYFDPENSRQLTEKNSSKFGRIDPILLLWRVGR